MKTRIVFLPVPKSFKKQFNGSGEAAHPAGAFPIDPDIPIPVEIPCAGEDVDSASENPPAGAVANISMEMIIRGMLRAIEERQVNQKWIDYYSGFVLFLRPDILEIVQEYEADSHKEEGHKEEFSQRRRGAES